MASSVAVITGGYARAKGVKLNEISKMPEAKRKRKFLGIG